MTNPKFKANIVDGKLDMTPEVKRRFYQRIKNLDGQKVAVSVNKMHNERSLRQLAYLWAGVYPAIAEGWSGHSTKEIHAIMKDRHLPKTFFTFRGKEYEVEISTSKLTTGKFNEYITRIMADVAVDGIMIPDPSGFTADMY